MIGGSRKEETSDGSRGWGEDLRVGDSLSSKDLTNPDLRLALGRVVERTDDPLRSIPYSASCPHDCPRIILKPEDSACKRSRPRKWMCAGTSACLGLPGSGEDLGFPRAI